jgi:hypothetical protein
METKAPRIEAESNVTVKRRMADLPHEGLGCAETLILLSTLVKTH